MSSSLFWVALKLISPTLPLTHLATATLVFLFENSKHDDRNPKTFCSWGILSWSTFLADVFMVQLSLWPLLKWQHLKGIPWPPCLEHRLSSLFPLNLLYFFAGVCESLTSWSLWLCLGFCGCLPAWKASAWRQTCFLSLPKPQPLVPGTQQALRSHVLSKLLLSLACCPALQPQDIF